MSYNIPSLAEFDEERALIIIDGIAESLFRNLVLIYEILGQRCDEPVRESCPILVGKA